MVTDIQRFRFLKDRLIIICFRLERGNEKTVLYNDSALPSF